jgi:hypothetical protein
MKKLKTFEDACKIEGLDPKKVIPDFSCYPEKDRKSMEAHAKLVIVVRAANRIENDGKEWTQDFSNWDEYKYEIWFEYDKGSSGFRYFAYDYWYSDSFVGSRLCFKTSELAEYIGNQFIDLYNEYLL